jgi:hypothetical protein
MTTDHDNAADDDAARMDQRVEELMREQGIKPIQSIDDLRSGETMDEEECKRFFEAATGRPVSPSHRHR